MPTPHLTPEVISRFLDYARDAGNWSGTPLIGGNVGGDPEDKGYLVNMKKAGLITTFREDDGTFWLIFTIAGREFAHAHGVEV